MPKNIFVDLNVILDSLLDRKGGDAATRVIELGEQATFGLSISAHTVTTFAYLLEAAHVPQQRIHTYLEWLLHSFHVVPTDTTVLRSAHQSKIKDYEDAVCEQAALAAKANVIITRNLKDFRESTVQASSPEEFLTKYDH